MIRTAMEWTSSGKTFKVGDFVVHIHSKDRRWMKTHATALSKACGVITSIEICDAGDGHVIIDGDPNTLTDFCYMELDRARYRDMKLKELGIDEQEDI
jgi:hypothetical protein